MKTLTKKILTVCLTLAMACALAIPAFADFDNGYNGYHIRNESIGGNNYLNMEGSGGPYNSRNVTVYSRTGDGDQIWSIANRGNGKKVYNSKTDSAGNAYTLNINSSNNNCNVYAEYPAVYRNGIGQSSSRPAYCRANSEGNSPVGAISAVRDTFAV